jgi:hypothetical protein
MKQPMRIFIHSLSLLALAVILGACQQAYNNYHAEADKEVDRLEQLLEELEQIEQSSLLPEIKEDADLRN